MKAHPRAHELEPDRKVGRSHLAVEKSARFLRAVDVNFELGQIRRSKEREALDVIPQDMGYCPRIRRRPALKPGSNRDSPRNGLSSLVFPDPEALIESLSKDRNIIEAGRAVQPQTTMRSWVGDGRRAE